MNAAAARTRIERRLTCEAARDRLHELASFAIAFAREAGFDAQTAHAVRLAIEEACVNVIDHGYAELPPGPIELTIADEGSRVRIEIADRARPFVPETVRAPDLDAAAEDRPLGGLGWFLIGELMDEVRHAPREGGGNRLTMVRRYRRQAPAGRAPDDE